LRATFANDADYRAFPRSALFDRIGMRSALIGTDPPGTFVGSSLGFATARDWARLGMLWLQRGAWHGVQVVPADWIATCLQPAAHAEGRFGQHVWLNVGEGEDSGRRPFARLPRDAFFFEGYEGQ
jgi:CubicO group peptidase (beta-lactamase class C family)